MKLNDLCDSMDRYSIIDILGKLSALDYEKLIEEGIEDEFYELELSEMLDENFKLKETVTKLEELIEYYNSEGSKNRKIMSAIFDPLHHIACQKDDVSALTKCIETLYEFKDDENIENVGRSIESVSRFIKNPDYAVKICQAAIDFKDDGAINIIMDSLSKASHYDLGRWEIEKLKEDDANFDEDAPDATKDLSVFDKYLKFIYKHKDHDNFHKVVNMLFKLDLNSSRYDPRSRMSLFDKCIDTNKFDITFDLLFYIDKSKARRGTSRLLYELNDSFYSDDYQFKVEMINYFTKMGDSFHYVFKCLPEVKKYEHINMSDKNLNGGTFGYFNLRISNELIDDLKYSLSNKEINNLVQAHEVSFKILDQSWYFSNGQFTEVFFSSFNELISLYDTLPEQKEGINLWCEEVVRLSKKEHQKLMKYSVQFSAGGCA